MCYHPVRLSMCRLPTTILSRLVCAKLRGKSDFPLRNQKLKVPLPNGLFAVWHRLPKTLLASAPLRIRLRLSWLSFSPLGFWPSRRGGHTPVLPVARQKLPTPAVLKELANRQAPAPRTGFTPALHVMEFNRRHGNELMHKFGDQSRSTDAASH